MARLRSFPEKLDRWVNGFFTQDLRRAAEEVVSDLQKAGPLWTGRFANSWVIETSGGSRSPINRRRGLPQPVKAPLLSGAEVYTKPEVKYTIYNIASYAGSAIDYTPDTFTRPERFPVPLQESVDPEKVKFGDRRSSIRGNLSGANDDEGPHSRTAPLDWYDNYLDGGFIDRTISVAMKKAFEKFPR
jgi:hypothetical protein